MPAILDRCVKHLTDQGKDTSSAFAICTASLKKKKERLAKINEAKKIKPELKESILFIEGVMVSSAPIARMNGSGKTFPIITDLYKTKDYNKEYKPSVKPYEENTMITKIDKNYILENIGIQTRPPIALSNKPSVTNLVNSPIMGSNPPGSEIKSTADQIYNSPKIKPGLQMLNSSIRTGNK